MVRARPKSSSNSSRKSNAGEKSESSRAANHERIADEVIDLIEEIDAREELREVIKQKDEQYAELLQKYTALKDATISKLNASIERITLEAEKIKQISSEAVIEELNQEIRKLNTNLKDMDKLKSENDMLKNETRALHMKVRSFEKKLAEKPATPPRKESHFDNASAQLIIELYQCMLGMRIIPQSREGNDARTFKCRMVDRQTKRVVEFTVTTTDSDEVECCPTRIDVGDSRECDFLKEGPIQFDLDLMSRFTKKLLTAIQQN